MKVPIEKLRLDSITEKYYDCNLIKEGSNVIIRFDAYCELVFESYLIFKCGYPNEEVYMHSELYSENEIHKHRLYALPDSDWIKEMDKMNEVHDRHRPGMLKDHVHFMIFFQDEVFECISTSYKLTQYLKLQP